MEEELYDFLLENSIQKTLVHAVNFTKYLCDGWYTVLRSLPQLLRETWNKYSVWDNALLRQYE